MANGVGSGSAYLQLQVPQDGLNQSLQYWGGIEAGKRRDEQAAAEAEKKRRDKQLERYNVDSKIFNIKDGGFSDLNSANRQLASSMLDSYAELKRKAKIAFNNNNTAEADRLDNQAEMIRSKFSNMQVTMDTHKKNFENYQKDFIDGKVSGWSKGFGNFYKGAMVKGKFKFGMSENGDIVRMVEFQDDNGNLKTQVVSDKDVQTGNFRYFLKQDTNKLTSDIAKDLGDTIQETTQGYLTTKNIQWGDKQNTAAKELINAKVGSPEFMADMVDQLDLYEEFGIDADNPPAMPEFTDEQKQVVADRLLETVKGKYDETMEQRFNAQKYAADTRAATERAKGKDDVVENTVSNLRFDVDRAMQGDYTVLTKPFTDATGVSYTIRNVIENPDGNTLTLVRDDGSTEQVARNPRAISDYVIGNTPEYTKLKIGSERVISATPNPYRGSTTQASGIETVADSLFDEEGKRTKSDDEFLRVLNRNFGITGTDVKTWGADTFEINGVTVDTSTKETFKRTLNQALSKNEADPLGLGL